jgi:hypothetical protein
MRAPSSATPWSGRRGKRTNVVSTSQDDAAVGAEVAASQFAAANDRLIAELMLACAASAGAASSTSIKLGVPAAWPTAAKFASEQFSKSKHMANCTAKLTAARSMAFTAPEPRCV